MSERERFEAWARTQPRHEGASMRFLPLNNAYIDFDLHGAWLAWQAARSGQAASGSSQGARSDEAVKRFGIKPWSTLAQLKDDEDLELYVRARIEAEGVGQPEAPTAAPLGSDDSLPTPLEMAEQMAAVDRGSVCPLCARNRPHEHSPEEIIIYRNGVKFGRHSTAPWAGHDHQGLAQESWPDAGSTGGEVRPRTNEHHEHRVRASDPDRANDARDCEGAGLPIDRDLSAARQPSELDSTLIAGRLPGWKLVPIEPTEEMHVAAVRTIVRCIGNDDFPPRVWRAMLKAAPTAAPPEPVAYRWLMNGGWQYGATPVFRAGYTRTEPLYAHPPARSGAGSEEARDAEMCQPDGLKFDAYGEPRTRFVRVSLDGRHCVMHPSEGDTYLKDARDAGDESNYTVRDVWLSEREFEDLGEFDGF